MPRWPEHDPDHKLPTQKDAKAWWAQHRRRQKNPDPPPSPRWDTPLGRALAQQGASVALARTLGLSKEAISLWKHGKSLPALENAPRISHALAVLHEQGLCGPAPSVIEILYPFGFPDGCERALTCQIEDTLAGAVGCDGSLPSDPPTE